MRVLADAVRTATGHDGTSSAKYAEAILDHLSREFGGQRVYVPVASRKPLHTDKIVRLLRSGQTFAEVARRFRVTERTIHNYVPGGMKRVRSAWDLPE